MDADPWAGRAARLEARIARAGVSLPAAAELVPLRQGELDGLCGLYTAINGMRLALAPAHPLSEADGGALFRHGVTHLHGRGRLYAAVRFGLRVAAWQRLCDALADKATRIGGGGLLLERPLQRQPDAALPDVLLLIRQALDLGTPVLVLLKGAYEHYSVLSGYTATRLRLFDSYGWHWITTGACGIEGQAAARHRLALDSVTLVHAVQR